MLRDLTANSEKWTFKKESFQKEEGVEKFNA